MATYTFRFSGRDAGKSMNVYDVSTTAQVTSGTTDANAVLTVSLPNGEYYAVAPDGRYVRGGVDSPQSAEAAAVARPSSIPSTVTLTKPYEAARQRYNLNETTMRYFRAAIARQRNGGTACNILCAGDSITNGQGTTGNLEVGSYPARLRSMLPTRWGSIYEGATFWNNQASGIPDNRLTIPAGWTKTNGYGFGNQAMFFSPVGPDTTAVTYGPVTCDTFDVYYLDKGPTGNFRYAIDGGALADSGAIGGSATATVRKISIPAGTVGSHTLSLAAPTAAKQAFLYAVGYRTSTNAGGVYVMRAGAPGSTTGDWAGNVNGGGSADMVAQVKVDLAICMLTTNDNGQNINPATSQANLIALGNSWRAQQADVLFVVPPPKVPGTYTQAQHTAAIYAAADATNTAVLDLSARWPVYNLSSAAPFLLLGGDNVHPTSAGHWDIAQAVAAALDF